MTGRLFVWSCQNPNGYPRIKTSCPNESLYSLGKKWESANVVRQASGAKSLSIGIATTSYFCPLD
jgi:hypothetical protein